METRCRSLYSDIFMEDDMERIGFIGAGSIGTPMVKRLILSGYDVIVCDKRAEALEGFEEMGARITDRPSECASNDMVIVMVANDSQVKEVVSGPDGLLSAVDPKQPPLVAVMSTVLPDTIRGLTAQCQEKNVRIVDAPVSGFPTRAEQGTLTIMVGGEKADLDAMRPVFEVLGEDIFHTGTLGSGEITKLINNIICVTNIFLTVEVMLIGQKCGMDPYELAGIMETSSGRNFATKDWEAARPIFEKFSRTIDLSKVLVDLSRKDIEHAQELARNVGVECPLLDHIVQAIKNSQYDEIRERWGAMLRASRNSS